MFGSISGSEEFQQRLVTPGSDVVVALICTMDRTLDRVSTVVQYNSAPSQELFSEMEWTFTDIMGFNPALIIVPIS